MTLDGLRVNHAGLDTAAEDLARAVKQIDDRLNRLESELAPLRSDWTGNAQQAYQVAKTKWDTAMQEMRDLLAGDQHRPCTSRTPTTGRRPARRCVVRHLTAPRTRRGRRTGAGPFATAVLAEREGRDDEPGTREHLRAGAGDGRVRHPPRRPRAPRRRPGRRAGARAGPQRRPARPGHRLRRLPAGDRRGSRARHRRRPGHPGHRGRRPDHRRRRRRRRSRRGSTTTSSRR